MLITVTLANGLLSTLKKSEDFPVLTGPYLGQKPAGKTPERFAPSVFFNTSRGGIFYEIHNCLPFSPDGKEIYYQVQTWRKKTKTYRKFLMVMKMEKGIWQEPKIAPFSGKYNDGNPTFSVDGRRLFFSSDRPMNKNKSINKDIWFVEREGFSWSDPQNLGPPINSQLVESCLTFADNSTVYFYRSMSEDNGSGEIFRSRLGKGNYEKPERLGTSVNTPGYEAFPVIASDESFLIFYSMGYPEGYGQYISFRRKDRTWTKAKNMGEKINGGGLAFCTSFSPDKKYLFFLIRKSSNIKIKGPDREDGIYWVDANIIEDLKPEDLK